MCVNNALHTDAYDVNFQNTTNQKEERIIVKNTNSAIGVMKDAVSL